MTDREVLIRECVIVRGSDTGTDGRTLHIRAVPWETEAQIGPSTWEVFTRGAYAKQVSSAHRVPLLLGHPANTSVASMTAAELLSGLVGRITSMVEGVDGLDVQARMGTSAAANDALALVNDGVLDQVSVGFAPIATATEKRAAGGQVVRRNRVNLDHVALLGSGAYGDAARVLAVRSASGPSIDDLREACKRFAVRL